MQMKPSKMEKSFVIVDLVINEYGEDGAVRDYIDWLVEINEKF